MKVHIRDASAFAARSEGVFTTLHLSAWSVNNSENVTMATVWTMMQHTGILDTTWLIT